MEYIFYQPHEVLILPLHYAEVVKCSTMPCDVTHEVDKGSYIHKGQQSIP